MSQREIMKQALEALQERYSGPLRDRAVEALEEALVEPDEDPDALTAAYMCGYADGVTERAKKEPELVAWVNVTDRTLEWSSPVKWKTATTGVYDKIPLYTAPPQRNPLSEEQVSTLLLKYDGLSIASMKKLIRAVEQAHGIK